MTEEITFPSILFDESGRHQNIPAKLSALKTGKSDGGESAASIVDAMAKAGIYGAVEL